MAALARPGPMEAATSATVTGPGNSRYEPSGSVIWIMGIAREKTKKRGGSRAFLGIPGTRLSARATFRPSAGREPFGGSSRCHNHDAFLALVRWGMAVF